MAKKETDPEYLCETADHPGDNGYQAVVRHVQPNGETRVCWMSSDPQPTQRGALDLGRVWVEAERGRLLRVDILRGRRKEQLPELLGQNLIRIDALKAARKDLGTQIRDVEEECRVLIGETRAPDVSINMHEGNKTYTYTMIDRGDAVTADPRQMSLFTDGVAQDPAENSFDDAPRLL